MSPKLRYDQVYIAFVFACATGIQMWVSSRMTALLQYGQFIEYLNDNKIAFNHLKDRMVALLAGRASEKLEVGKTSTVAADGHAKVTDVARDCATRFGMGADVGQAVVEQKRLRWLGDRNFENSTKDCSETTAREIDLAVRALIADASGRAKSIVRGRRADLLAGIALLLERDPITPDDFAPHRLHFVAKSENPPRRKTSADLPKVRAVQ